MKQLFHEVLFFTKNHLGSMMKIVVPYVTLTSIVGLLLAKLGLAPVQWLLLNFLISAAVHVVYVGAIIKYLHNTASDSTSTHVQISAQEWRDLFLVKMLYSLLVFAGLVLFIVPGVIIAVRCCLTDFHVVLEKQKPVDTILSSWTKTGAYFFELLVMLALVSSILVLSSVFLQQLSEQGAVLYALSQILSIAIFSMTLIFWTVFFFRVYTLSQDTEKTSS